MITKFFDNDNLYNNKKSGIYGIINISTFKIYIGSAVKFNSRCNWHLFALKSNKHHNKYLQRSFNKFGSDFFIFKVIEYIDDKNDLITREQFWIDEFMRNGNCYNLLPTAMSNLGYKHSEEAKLKISIAKKGKRQTKRKILSEMQKYNSSVTQGSPILCINNLTGEELYFTSRKQAALSMGLMSIKRKICGEFSDRGNFSLFDVFI